MVRLEALTARCQRARAVRSPVVPVDRVRPRTVVGIREMGRKRDRRRAFRVDRPERRRVDVHRRCVVPSRRLPRHLVVGARRSSVRVACGVLNAARLDLRDHVAARRHPTHLDRESRVVATVVDVANQRSTGRAAAEIDIRVAEGARNDWLAEHDREADRC